MWEGPRSIAGLTTRRHGCVVWGQRWPRPSPAGPEPCRPGLSLSECQPQPGEPGSPCRLPPKALIPPPCRATASCRECLRPAHSPDFLYVSCGKCRLPAAPCRLQPPEGSFTCFPSLDIDINDRGRCLRPEHSLLRRKVSCE